MSYSVTAAMAAYADARRAGEIIEGIRRELHWLAPTPSRRQWLELAIEQWESVASYRADFDKVYALWYPW